MLSFSTRDHKPILAVGGTYVWKVLFDDEHFSGQATRIIGARSSDEQVVSVAGITEGLELKGHGPGTATIFVDTADGSDTLTVEVQEVSSALVWAEETCMSDMIRGLYGFGEYDETDTRPYSHFRHAPIGVHLRSFGPEGDHVVGLEEALVFESSQGSVTFGPSTDTDPNIFASTFMYIDPAFRGNTWTVTSANFEGSTSFDVVGVADIDGLETSNAINYADEDDVSFRVGRESDFAVRPSVSGKHLCTAFIHQAFTVETPSMCSIDGDITPDLATAPEYQNVTILPKQVGECRISVEFIDPEGGPSKTFTHTLTIEP